VTFVELGNAFLGTTFTLAIIFLLSIKIRLYLELMQDCMTHLVALYHKNPKRDTETALKAIAKAI
jgi:hypothetical protein